MNSPNPTSKELVQQLDEYISRWVAAHGGSTEPVVPSHRVKFHWPPHPISYSFHVLASDWTGRASFVAHGETFEVQVARNAHGVFGRCEAIWHEDRGANDAEMLENLRASSDPLFQRQLRISRTLELEGRFKGRIPDLAAIDLLKLLYCEDRDVANDARVQIETHASSGIFFDPLLSILNDNRHPNRRTAQWCVLDLFEDLHSFTASPEDAQAAISAIEALLWNAPDDFARTIYKAGVVLGGHMPAAEGGPALLRCINAPSRTGRRSAIHAVFHLVEWNPELRITVVEALQAAAQSDEEPALREFARLMARDIAEGVFDHAPEPIFDNER